MIPNDGKRPSMDSLSFAPSQSPLDLSVNSRTSFSNASSNQKSKDDSTIAREEDKAVFKFRVAVAIFLTLCTVAAACIVFLNTRNQEQHDFEASFHDFSTKILGSLASSFDQAFASLDAFAVSVVSYTTATNMTWPFIVIPNSGTRLAKVVTATKSTVVSIATIVPAEKKDAWNTFSLEHGPAWVDDTLRVQKNYPGYVGTVLDNYTALPIWYPTGLPPNASEHFPLWQTFPVASTYFAAFNLDTSPWITSIDILRSAKIHVSKLINDPTIDDAYNDILQDYVPNGWDVSEPVSEIHFPIFESAASDVSIKDTAGVDSELVGFLWVSFYWRNQMLNMLPTGIDGIVLVVSTSCNSTFTYEINGPNANFLGWGDHHDKKYDDLVLESTFERLNQFVSRKTAYSGVELSHDECEYTFRAYPSATFESDYTSSNPWVYTIVAVAIFLFTSLVFWIYDLLVERRQAKVMSTAMKSSAIVSSLFPSNVRDRLFNHDVKEYAPNQVSQKNRLKSFMTNNSGTDTAHEERGTHKGVLPWSNRPIADLFPEVTVMFADISGFTAWSSTREPSQVFILLESLYGKFDALASKRGIFKVETIGDCYVAVAGLPEPRKDHAVAVVNFACECCKQLHKLVKKLSVELGPDTEDLTMRFGLNSGPVTAGVLRGEKSRFQLFGDTVNTAARMESTGRENRIQVSQSTADELVKHNMGHWLRMRQDVIEIKGKGRMTTYWVNPNTQTDSNENILQGMTDSFEESQSLSFTERNGEHGPNEKIDRLVDWNTDILARLLRSVVSHRLSKMNGRPQNEIIRVPSHTGTMPNSLPIEEVREIIELPDFDPNISHDPDSIKLDITVLSQLRAYVAAIAATYGGSNNPFHNFEHASHVCMSVAKLMSRMVATDECLDQSMESTSIASIEYQRTFGIASDPLTLFACAFAALIHDADHPGVPNAQLIKEGTLTAQKYKRSVAEQRSVDLAWSMLMEDEYQALRHAICPTRSEIRRFRQLVVSSVMATDIMDKDLKQLRNERWDKAFDTSLCMESDACTTREAVNRKATIVIEHLIQASDVAHTMQHWHVFRKWNERLFWEMYKAYECGRAERNPAEYWYQGELNFFDFYIVPLAKKLSDCGVFGVSSDEYLNYALKNREEWERKGQCIVSDMLEFSMSKMDA